MTPSIPKRVGYTPAENAARQAAHDAKQASRAAKRERAHDVRIVALMASVLRNGSRDERIAEAWALLSAAGE